MRLTIRLKSRSDEKSEGSEKQRSIAALASVLHADARGIIAETDRVGTTGACTFGGATNARGVTRRITSAGTEFWVTGGKTPADSPGARELEWAATFSKRLPGTTLAWLGL
ncbi:MAG: hypothetical protein BroJett014_11120 [Planctomycetota bacterium]|nr:MAG: hypothetical protein BroJett014_11120 [Planctomycetota bacterium]